ncbi:hypothetical protein cyc_01938 [Cyclospora cayetanensis]|uniref:Uncharacterized protein n=1 Tax=Cyclospora cayetanensis TaxID=88456 RepID=A0A1D3CVQ2_9EIME|nr:hypothetical protein cyc_01938 [Cyclospora cayetanensis]
MEAQGAPRSRPSAASSGVRDFQPSTSHNQVRSARPDPSKVPKPCPKPKAPLFNAPEGHKSPASRRKPPSYPGAPPACPVPRPKLTCSGLDEALDASHKEAFVHWAPKEGLHPHVGAPHPDRMEAEQLLHQENPSTPWSVSGCRAKTHCGEARHCIPVFKYAPTLCPKSESIIQVYRQKRVKELWVKIDTEGERVADLFALRPVADSLDLSERRFLHAVIPCLVQRALSKTSQDAAEEKGCLDPRTDTELRLHNAKPDVEGPVRFGTLSPDSRPPRFPQETGEATANATATPHLFVPESLFLSTCIELLAHGFGVNGINQFRDSITYSCRKLVAAVNPSCCLEDRQRVMGRCWSRFDAVIQRFVRKKQQQEHVSLAIRDLKDEEECTFHPEINSTPRYLKKSSTEGIPKYHSKRQQQQLQDGALPTDPMVIFRQFCSRFVPDDRCSDLMRALEECSFQPNAKKADIRQWLQQEGEREEAEAAGAEGDAKLLRQAKLCAAAPKKWILDGREPQHRERRQCVRLAECVLNSKGQPVIAIDTAGAEGASGVAAKSLHPTSSTAKLMNSPRAIPGNSRTTNPSEKWKEGLRGGYLPPKMVFSMESEGDKEREDRRRAVRKEDWSRYIRIGARGLQTRVIPRQGDLQKLCDEFTQTPATPPPTLWEHSRRRRPCLERGPDARTYTASIAGRAAFASSLSLARCCEDTVPVPTVFTVPAPPQKLALQDSHQLHAQLTREANFGSLKLPPKVVGIQRDKASVVSPPVPLFSQLGSPFRSHASAPSLYLMYYTLHKPKRSPMEERKTCSQEDRACS